MKMMNNAYFLQKLHIRKLSLCRDACFQWFGQRAAGMGFAWGAQVYNLGGYLLLLLANAIHYVLPVTSGHVQRWTVALLAMVKSTNAVHSISLIASCIKLLMVSETDIIYNWHFFIYGLRHGCGNCFCGHFHVALPHTRAHAPKRTLDVHLCSIWFFEFMGSLQK